MLLKSLWPLSLLFISCLSFAADNPNHKASDKIMYKYTDEHGATFISNDLPPEIADKGYTILNALGQIKEVIPPKLSEAELIKETKQKKLETAQAQQAQKQAEKDNALLKMFTSIEDIEQSKNEQIASITILETITLDNIKRVENQLTTLKKAALVYQAKKQTIPAILDQSIKTSEQQIADNKQFLQRKQEEKNQLKEQYAHIIERFKTVKAKHNIENNPENKTTIQD